MLRQAEELWPRAGSARLYAERWALTPGSARRLRQRRRPNWVLAAAAAADSAPDERRGLHAGERCYGSGLPSEGSSEGRECTAHCAGERARRRGGARADTLVHTSDVVCDPATDGVKDGCPTGRAEDLDAERDPATDGVGDGGPGGGAEDLEGNACTHEQERGPEAVVVDIELEFAALPGAFNDMAVHLFPRWAPDVAALASSE